MSKRRFTDAEERDIRRAFFVKGIAPKSIMETWKISDTLLRRIVGGPLTTKHKGIESVYT